MNEFEYQITNYPSDDFKNLVYFCSEEGDCTLESLPSDQLNSLEKKLNKKGKDGWELVQLSFNKSGIVAFWKRRL